MSKKAWIISYIFAILIALCYISIFEYFAWNKFFLIVIACFFLCYPIIISKRAKEVTYTREQDFMFTHILVFLGTALMCSMFFHIMPERDYLIAVTKNLEKANQIQNFLTTKTRPTGRCLVLNDNNNTFSYGITIRENQLSKKDSIQLQADLLDSSIMDDSIKIIPNIIYTKNHKKLLERLENELRWIILHINGVESARVSINLNNKDINSPDTKVKDVSVSIETKQGVDCKKIHSQIYMLIEPAFENQSSTKIKIYNSTLFHEAKQEYKNKNYFKALELLEILETFDYQNFHKDVESLIKFINIDDKIKKEPNNYRLYIERGDLKNVPLWSMFCCDSTFLSDIEGAIEDYNKALELNPKAYEVYEKRGNAWAEVTQNPNRTIGTKALRNSEDDQHAIDDWLKAIELTGGNDELYEKLGNIYKDPKMKLKYYNQIKNLYPEHLSVPVPRKVNQFNFGFDIGPFFYLPLKVASCYAQLGEYDEAIKILENAKKYGEQHYTVANLIFLYNWKAGHYMAALKNADSCSVWVCKLAGVFF